MKAGIHLFLSVLCILCTGCAKERAESKRTVTGITGYASNTAGNWSFQYAFGYDGQQRVTSLAYTGNLYVYGEGHIRAVYTYEVDYSGENPAVTLKIQNAVIRTDTGDVEYEGLPGEELLPLSFDDQGKVRSIAGRNLWLHTDETTLGYDSSGRLLKIGEDDGIYYKTAVEWGWDNGNLISQTYQTLGHTGEVSHSIYRQFRYSDRVNHYSIDLNWLIGDLALGFQNGLTPLALIGLLGNRSDHLIASTTEWDGSEAEVGYTLDGNAVSRITRQALGTSYTFRISYD